MARPKEFDPDVALAAAMRKFWEGGFESTSLSDLTACTGVQKASLYATYGDKRCFFLTALARYQDERYARMKAALSAPGSPCAAIGNLLSAAVKEAAARDGSGGCLYVNTAVELGYRDAEIAGILRHQAQRFAALFEAALERGKRAGEVRRDLDTRAVAQFLLTVLFGLYVGGKAPISERNLKQVVAVAMSVLGRGTRAPRARPLRAAARSPRR
jgi:TetR/AcrR family transcriptional repressor of nem operon